MSICPNAPLTLPNTFHTIQYSVSQKAITSYSCNHSLLLTGSVARTVRHFLQKPSTTQCKYAILFPSAGGKIRRTVHGKNKRKRELVGTSSDLAGWLYCQQNNSKWDHGFLMMFRLCRPVKQQERKWSSHSLSLMSDGKQNKVRIAPHLWWVYRYLEARKYSSAWIWDSPDNHKLRFLLLNSSMAETYT